MDEPTSGSTPPDTRARATRALTALLGAAAVVTVTVAACSGPQSGTPQPPPAPVTSAPATSAPATSTPASSPGGLLWPVTDAAQAAALQQQVDTGSQPWLLDPSEVALNFATTVPGWTSPQAGAPDGGTVQVTDAQGGRMTVTLIQPGRTGPQGIWVVSAVRPN